MSTIPPSQPGTLTLRNLVWEACQSGHTSFIADLIVKNILKINKPLDDRPDECPALLIAVFTESLPVARLLLEQGADPNIHGGRILYTAVMKQNIELMELLLSEGATLDRMSDTQDGLIKAVETKQFDVVSLLLESSTTPWAKFLPVIRRVMCGTWGPETIGPMLYCATQLVDRQNEERSQKLAKYARLCRAIVREDELGVTELLGIGDYASYAEVLDDEDLRPACVAVRYSKTTLVTDVFLGGRIDLAGIYFAAVGKGDLELIRLCAGIRSFEHARAVKSRGETALHEACRFGNITVIEMLLNEYQLELNARDFEGRTPLFLVEDTELLRCLLEAFPEADVNARNVAGQVLLGNGGCRYDCERYTLLLEHGAAPEYRNPNDRHRTRTDTDPRKCKLSLRCPVVRHLQKLMLIDENYVRRTVYTVLKIEVSRLNDIKISKESKYKDELRRMKSMKINQSTSMISRKSLYDFMLFTANEAARYSRNEQILLIYDEYGEDFQRFLPYYGFVLNYQLRRGAIRRERLENALDLLSFAFESGLPQFFSELIFGFFSNSTLKRFSIGCIKSQKY